MRSSTMGLWQFRWQRHQGQHSRVQRAASQRTSMLSRLGGGNAEVEGKSRPLDFREAGFLRKCNSANRKAKKYG